MPKIKIPSVKVGDVFSTKHFGDFEILETTGRTKIRIRFLDTGSERVVSEQSINRRSVKDLYKPHVHGVGYIGEGKYPAKVNDKHLTQYKIWNDMLKRCYNPNSKDYEIYGAIGVTVCDEWLCYQNFCEWVDSEHSNFKPGFKLDKDIKNPGNKVYGPESCVFVPNHVNCLTNIKHNPEDYADLPVGITAISTGGYIARVNMTDPITKKAIRKYLGYHKNFNVVWDKYKEVKEQYMKDIAEYYYSIGDIPESIYQSLMQWKAEPYKLK